MKYGMFTLGSMEAVFNIVGGEQKVERLLQGKIVSIPFKWKGVFGNTTIHINGIDFAIVTPEGLDFDSSPDHKALECRAYDCGLEMCQEGDADGLLKSHDAVRTQAFFGFNGEKYKIFSIVDVSFPPYGTRINKTEEYRGLGSGLFQKWVFRIQKHVRR